MRLRFFYFSSLLILIFTGSLCAEILNAGFEVSEPNEILGIDMPVDWECHRYTAVDSSFIPDADSSRSWKLDDINGLEPYEGEFFVMLSTFTITADIRYAKISQIVEFFEGQKLSGAYFFGTYDYSPFDDYARITLVPLDPEEEDRIILDVDVSDIGSRSSMDGWETFEYIFTAENAGIYNLVISVTDLADNALTSFFAVDGLGICWIPEHGDINGDCEVNLTDFYCLSNDWLQYDPNYISSDPNFWREYETDFDGSHQVDVNDLSLMSENWLYTQ